MKDHIYKTLCRSPLMQGVSETLLRDVADTGRLRLLKGRFGRIAQDELEERLFLIISGEMRMVHTAPDGQECIMGKVGAGDFFCLSAFITGHSCSGEMVSSGTTEICFWPKEKVRTLLSGEVAFQQNLLQHMACEVEQEREMRTLSRCCKADTKVAAYLLHKIKNSLNCSGCGAVHIDVRPVGMTAQELGIARETFTRSLQRLINREGISYQRGIVKVADITLLESVLEEDDCACRCNGA